MIKRYPRFIYIPNRNIVNGNMTIEYEIENGRILSPLPNYDYEKINDSCEFEKRNWVKNIPFVSRLSFVENYTCEELYSSAIEELLKVEIPEISKYLRVMMLELSRIRGFFLYIFNISSALEFEMPREWALSDINRISKIISEINNNEYFSPYIIPGGIKTQFSSTNISVITEYLEYLKKRMKDYDKIIFQNEIFRLRTQNVGVIPRQMIEEYGVTGFIARSANVTFDIRKRIPYEIYKSIHFDSFRYEHSDIYTRVICRRNEISNSIQILDYIFSNIPVESSTLNKDIYQSKARVLGEGTVIKRIEGINGEFILFLESVNDERPKTIKFRSPMFVIGGELLKKLLENTSLDDLDLVLASLSLVPMEMDI